MTSVGEFTSGQRLNADFYAGVVAPLVGAVPHAAALLGTGSDVLGYDSERSTDHGWGPRLTVFVDPADVAGVGVVIDRGLPATFAGWPVRYGWDGTPVSHHVTVTSVGSWVTAQLGVDATRPLSAVDWLLIPQQKLLEVVGGALYRDDRGEVTSLRHRLSWYPEDVWLWMLAAQWRRVAQEEAFVGRTAEAGDDLGSRLLVARLARDLIHLWFLLSRCYRPYSKWLGTAFHALPDSAPLGRLLASALGAADHPARESALCSAYESVARRHNELALTRPVDPMVRSFYNRPYRVLMADRFAEACREAVAEPALRALPLVGSVDQVADSTDVLSYPERSRVLEALYRRSAGG
jgi:hypothetical protein